MWQAATQESHFAFNSARGVGIDAPSRDTGALIRKVCKVGPRDLLFPERFNMLRVAACLIHTNTRSLIQVQTSPEDANFHAVPKNARLNLSLCFHAK